MTLAPPTQAHLVCDQHMPAPCRRSLAGGEVVFLSRRCPEKPTANEDSVALIPYGEDAAVLVVADGMGGSRAGDQASRIAVEELAMALDRAVEEELPLRTAILNGIEQANHAVQALGIGAATTLAAVEVQNEKGNGGGGIRCTVRPYHVGDSMILLVGQRGKMKLQTVSHSPVGFAVEAGLLDEQEAMHHEDRNLVSNVLGAADMRIEIGPILKMAPYDTLLLATDGLFDNLHVEEIVARIRKGPLHKAGAALAEDASARMTTAEEGQPSKPDDLTFLVFRQAAGRPTLPSRSSGDGSRGSA